MSISKFGIYSNLLLFSFLMLFVVTQGVFRVNPRNYEECYVSNPDGGDELDILIYGNVARNRAFQGDVVVLRIRDRANWAVRLFIYHFKS